MPACNLTQTRNRSSSGEIMKVAKVSLQPDHTGQQDKCKRQRRTAYVKKCYNQTSKFYLNLTAIEVLKFKKLSISKAGDAVVKYVLKDSFYRCSPSSIPETVLSSKDKLVDKIDKALLFTKFTLLWKTWTNTENNHFRK